jgi:hypothetical protein
VVPFMINLVISMLIPRLVDVLCLLVGLHGSRDVSREVAVGEYRSPACPNRAGPFNNCPFPLPGRFREVIYSQMAGTGHECAEPVDKHRRNPEGL